MTRKQRIGGRAYAASALGVAMVGVLALALLPTYPLSAGAILFAIVLALSGLALRWRKRLRQRRRSSSYRLQI